MPAHDVVYLVQLEPVLDPTRLKVGYTNCLERRLRQFRALCPAARILKSTDGDRMLEAVLLVNFDIAFRRVGRELFAAEPEAAGERFDQVITEVNR